MGASYSGYVGEDWYYSEIEPTVHYEPMCPYYYRCRDAGLRCHMCVKQQKTYFEPIPYEITYAGY